MTGNWGLEALAIDSSSQSLNPLFPFHTSVLASAPAKGKLSEYELLLLFLLFLLLFMLFPGIAVSLHARKLPPVKGTEQRE